jgi:methylthioribose-1-phosphate isomerase
LSTSPPTTAPHIATLHWLGGIDGHLRLIDQTRLPGELVEIDCFDVETVWEAIRSLRVRGAPAIAIAAAYGVCLGLQRWPGGTSAVAGTVPLFSRAPTEGWSADFGELSRTEKKTGLSPLPAPSPGREAFLARFDEIRRYLATSRPTAVNLFWALDRLDKLVSRERKLLSLRERSGEGNLVRDVDRPHPDPLPKGEGAVFSPDQIRSLLLDEAHAIVEEDRRVCRAIGRHGAKLLQDGQGVLTHCNAGGLATADYGTALAVFFSAHESGKRLHVYADETRPLLQGARLTAWELQQRGIDVTLICDSMAAQVMREGRVQAVVTGADRIAANGDTANKIGTYGVALLAAAHDIPFYIAAPLSTFDLSLASGDQIPIEQRSPEEITHGFGRRTAPEGIAVYNPAFDVTPAHLIRAIICERGLIQPVTRERIAEVARPG